jgi:hypothetical protein
MKTPLDTVQFVEHINLIKDLVAIPSFVEPFR